MLDAPQESGNAGQSWIHVDAMRFEHVAVVDARPDVVFSLTQDYSRRLAWDPFLREARLLGGAAAPAVGVRAWCVARSGVGMETEYVAFDPPRVVAVRMTRGPRFLEVFGGTWDFKSVDSNRTKVTFRYQLRARPRWLAWMLEPIARWWFAHETRARIEALSVALRKQTDASGACT